MSFSSIREMLQACQESRQPLYEVILESDLAESFNEAQLEALRISLGKTKEGTKSQLRKWAYRKFVVYSEQTGLYTKTQKYLLGISSDGITKTNGHA